MPEFDHLAMLIGRHATERELDRWVLRATGETLRGAFAAGNDTISMAAASVLKILQEAGPSFLDRFLREVYRSRELQRQLVAEIDRLNPAIRTTLNRPDLDFKFGSGGIAMQTAPLRNLLKTYAGNMLDGDWFEELGIAQSRVCRIERMGNSFGTGFLVGPSTILTNCHVMDEAGPQPGLVARFGFRLHKNGSVDRGTEVKITANLMTRPPTQGERDGHPDNPPTPTAGDLDFALLSLEQPHGDVAGYFRFDGLNRDLVAGEPLIVIQYPRQAFLSISMDTNSVTGLQHEGRRLRYNILSEPGSSGSPCLSMDLRLVALHHFGDPGWNGSAYRQGIPARLIANEIGNSEHAARLAGGN